MKYYLYYKIITNPFLCLIFQIGILFTIRTLFISDVISCEEIAVENNVEKPNRLESIALFVGLSMAVILISFYGNTLFDLSSVTSLTEIANMVPVEVDHETAYISIAEWDYWKASIPYIMDPANMIQGFVKEEAAYTPNIISADMIADIGATIYDKAMWRLPQDATFSEIQMRIKNVVLENIDVWGPMANDDLMAKELPPFELLKAYFHFQINATNDPTTKKVLEFIGTIVKIEGNCSLTKTDSTNEYRPENFLQHLNQFKEDHAAYIYN